MSNSTVTSIAGLSLSDRQEIATTYIATCSYTDSVCTYVYTVSVENFEG